MNFTFGIITSGQHDQNIEAIIDTIERQDIPNYEIIVIGNSNVNRNNTRIIPFDESLKKAWITKKKNMITEAAQYENIVYMHDYILLEDNWYEGFLAFGNDFKVCMTMIVNPDGSRFRDWVLWPHNMNHMDSIINGTHQCLLPYDLEHLSKYQYISGAYWVAKKDVMEEFPLDERLVWGEGEDVVWSKQIREKYNFSMNTYSTVKTLKFKDPVFHYPSEDRLNELIKVNNLIKVAKQLSGVKE